MGLFVVGVVAAAAAAGSAAARGRRAVWAKAAETLGFALAPWPILAVSLACSLPAWRAARVDPMVALRDM